MRGQSILVAVLLVGLTSHLLIGQSASIEQQFTWQYAGRSWSLTHRFSTEHYGFFRTLPRILDYTQYARYVDDPRDDEQIQSLVDALERLAADAGLDAWERLNLVIAFVQSIPYAEETCEYPRYPLETLVEKAADCEDAAILTAAILRQMRFEVVLLAFLEEKHMAVGLNVAPPTSVTAPPFAWNGGAYYYLEPTSVGWAIGEIPERYRSQPAVIPLTSVVASRRR